MKKIILIFIYSVFCISLFSQKIGDWEYHFSYEDNVSQIYDADGIVYAVSDGKLFSYNPEDQSVEVHVKPDGGNDDIALISYNTKNKKLLILRTNYDIDLYDDKGYFFNIPFLKDDTQNIDKTFNYIYMHDDFAYISTNYGLLIISMSRNEIAENCNFNQKFYATAIKDNVLYASSEQGVRRIDLNKNIADIQEWEKVPISAKNTTSISFTDSNLRDIAFYKNKLYLLLPDKTVFIWDENDPELDNVLDKPTKLYSVNQDRLITYSSSYNAFFDFTDIKNYVGLYSPSFLITVFPDVKKNGQYWVAEMNKNLSRAKNAGKLNYEIIKEEEGIRPQGPYSNYHFYLEHDGEKLMSTRGGYALGDRLGKDGLLSEYTGKWYNYDINEIEGTLGFRPRDFVAVISDPTDRSHLFVTSWGEGLYEFKNRKFVNLHKNFAPVIDYVPDNYKRVGSLVYDKKGNLWVANTQINDILSVYTTAKEWHKPQLSPIPSITTNGVVRIIFDKYSRIWIVGNQSVPFLLIAENESTSGLIKEYKSLTSFSDQDYNMLSIGQINDITEDKNGNIWTATTAGPFIIYNSRNILSSSYDIKFNKIKIPRNDGTNIADILLENVNINRIVVDGANRKWICTSDAGVYLVSENGQETIHHFDTKNSPLPSNNVLSLAIDPISGIVYIGTEKGLVSYRSDATTGSSDYSDVYVYPNPVRPEYTGVITVHGLKANSNVKITDIRGNLIEQGKSLGGQFTWNGKNAKGTDVDTGTYLVFGASEDGKEGVVTKILIVR